MSQQILYDTFKLIRLYSKTLLYFQVFSRMPVPIFTINIQTSRTPFTTPSTLQFHSVDLLDGYNFVYLLDSENQIAHSLRSLSRPGFTLEPPGNVRIPDPTSSSAPNQ
jgi:hypothetical protein